MTGSSAAMVVGSGVLGGVGGTFTGAALKHPVMGGLAGAVVGLVAGVLTVRAIDKDVDVLVDTEMKRTFGTTTAQQPAPRFP